MDSRQDKEANDLAEDLRRAVGTFVRAVRREADTPRSAQSETLALLDNDDALNIAALARQRQVTHQTMRIVAGQLEQAGLLVRVPDPQDRRSQLFSLSAEGRKVLVDEREKRAKAMTALIRDHVSNEERAVLRHAVAILDRLSQHSL